MHGWRFYRRLNRLARLLRLDLVVLRHNSLFAEIRCADFLVDQWRAKKTPRNACKVHLPRYPGRGSLTVSLQRKHDSLSVRKLERLLDVCRGWTLKPEEKAQLDGES